MVEDRCGGRTASAWNVCHQLKAEFNLWLDRNRSTNMGSGHTHTQLHISSSTKTFAQQSTLHTLPSVQPTVVSPQSSRAASISNARAWGM